MNFDFPARFSRLFPRRTVVVNLAFPRCLAACPRLRVLCALRVKNPRWPKIALEFGHPLRYSVRMNNNCRAMCGEPRARAIGLAISTPPSILCSCRLSAIRSRPSAPLTYSLPPTLSDNSNAHFVRRDSREARDFTRFPALRGDNSSANCRLGACFRPDDDSQSTSRQQLARQPKNTPRQNAKNLEPQHQLSSASSGPRDNRCRRSEPKGDSDVETISEETRRPRDIDKQGDNETRRPRDRETERPGDRETGRPRDRETGRPGDRETRRIGPLSATDPTGLTQGCNPLTNLFGCYSGKKVTVNKPVSQIVTSCNLFASPTCKAFGRAAGVHPFADIRSTAIEVVHPR